MAFSNAQHLAVIFGLLGNIMSFLVFLAPIPTFYKIYKKKSSDGYQSIPYVVALLSASLLLYYEVLKTKATMIITINASGILIELTYLVLFLIYASTKEKIPNILGLLLGISQMILYLTYKDGNKEMAETNEGNNQQEVSLDMERLTPLQSAKLYPTSQHQAHVTEMDIFPSGKPIEPNNNV